MLTIPHESFTPYPIPNTTWLKGQLERGSQSGFLHWQLIVAFTSKKSLAGVKECFGPTCHAELSRSEAANSYVEKDDTYVDGTRFEFGVKPIRRNSKTDWEQCWERAKLGDVMGIPAHVRIQCYRTIRTIASDYDKPVPMERQCFVYWGRSGAGKSRRAWDEAGLDAYSKDPRTKFWDGYQAEQHVVIDEFRGGIDIAHMLRWLDRYPVRVEIKGSSRPLAASKIWITSNVDPRRWYPEIDQETLDALLRRLEITHFN